MSTIKLKTKSKPQKARTINDFISQNPEIKKQLSELEDLNKKIEELDKEEKQLTKRSEESSMAMRAIEENLLQRVEVELQSIGSQSAMADGQ